MGNDKPEDYEMLLRMIGISVLTLLALSCSSDDETGGPDPEYITGMVDGTSLFSASRVDSGVGDELVFIGEQESAHRWIRFHLKFDGDSSPRAGTWPLGPSLDNSAYTGNIPPNQLDCQARGNSALTIVNVDAERIEGTFYLEGECDNTQFTVEEGRFSICITDECVRRPGWRYI